MAIEILSFPIKMVIFHSSLYVYQRVAHLAQHCLIELMQLCFYQWDSQHQKANYISSKVYTQHKGWICARSPSIPMGSTCGKMMPRVILDTRMTNWHRFFWSLKIVLKKLPKIAEHVLFHVSVNPEGLFSIILIFCWKTCCMVINNWRNKL